MQYNHPTTARCQLKLYVSGHTEQTAETIVRLRQVLGDIMDTLETDEPLEVVDILENPEEALRERIIATPTLVKVFPAPAKRVFGDLSDVDQVFVSLELLSKA